MKTLISLLVSWPVWLLAQTAPPIDAAVQARAGISALPSPTLITINPACLAFSKGCYAGTGSLSRFGLKQLIQSSAFFQYGNSRSGFCLNLNRFGYSLYHETSISAGIGLKLNPKNAIGVSLQPGYTYVAEGTAHPVTLRAGCGYYLDREKWGFGTLLTFPANNFHAGGINTSEIKVGFQFRADKKIVVMSQINIAPVTRPSFSLAFQYQAFPELFLVGGIQTYPFKNSFGFGYQKSGIKIWLAAQVQEKLGWSPGILLVYKLNRP